MFAPALIELRLWVGAGDDLVASRCEATVATQPCSPELLRGVQAGNCYTITLRGEAVAHLVPAGVKKDADTAEAAEQMKQFMQGRATSGGGLDKQSRYRGVRAPGRKSFGQDGLSPRRPVQLT